jgi:hypothetical protein
MKKEEPERAEERQRSKGARRYRRETRKAPAPVSRTVLVLVVPDLKALDLTALPGVRVATRTLVPALLRRQRPDLPPFSRARLLSLRGTAPSLTAALRRIGSKAKSTLRVPLALPPQPASRGGEELWELVVLTR